MSSARCARAVYGARGHCAAWEGMVGWVPRRLVMRGGRWL